jgi:excisionase family DNA binding protein
MADALMKYPEAAQYLSMGISTLKMMKKNNEIPFIQNGRSVRFDKAKLDEWKRQKSSGH